jgi:hypothetical protein
MTEAATFAGSTFQADRVKLPAVKTTLTPPVTRPIEEVTTTFKSSEEVINQKLVEKERKIRKLSLEKKQ